MASVKWHTTKYPGIYTYETKKGTRYGVRVRYKTLSGKPDELSKSGLKTLNEAKARKREFDDLIAAGKITIAENRSLTLDEWFVKFLEVKNYDVTSGDYKGFCYRYKKYIQPVFGNWPIRNIDRSSYQVFINELYHSGKCRKRKGYVQTIHKTFMRMINEAVRCEIIESSERFRNLNYENDPDELTRKKFFEEDEREVFYNRAREELTKQVFCMFSLASWGLRRGEINGVRVQDVVIIDSTPGSESVVLKIQVTRTPAKPNGQSTKTPGSIRDLPFKGEMAELLIYSVNYAKRIALDFNKILHQDDFIFISPKNGKTYNVQYLYSKIKWLQDLTGIHAYTHKLRHTFSTDAHQNGANPRDVADFMGHTKVQMTQHYTHSTMTGKENVIDLLEQKRS